MHSVVLLTIEVVDYIYIPSPLPLAAILPDMKVFSLSLLSVSPNTPAQATMLGTAQDLSSFSFYQRGSIGEFMTFFTKVCIWL